MFFLSLSLPFAALFPIFVSDVAVIFLPMFWNYLSVGFVTLIIDQKKPLIPGRAGEGGVTLRETLAATLLLYYS